MPGLQKILLSTAIVIVTIMMLGIIACRKIDIQHINKLKTNAIRISGPYAIASAEIIDLADETVDAYGICLCSDSLEPNADCFYSNLGNNPQKGQYSDTLRNLQAGTPYYFRPYIKTTSGYTYGEAMLFTAPLSNALIVHTGNAEIDGETSFRLYGSLSGIGSLQIKGYGIELSDFSDMQSPEIVFQTNNTSIASSFSKTISGLERGKRYYYSAFCDVKDGQTLRGNIESFVVPQLRVSTNNFVPLGSTSVTMFGEIQQLGYYPISNHGFVWSFQNANPIYTDNRINLGGRENTGVYQADFLDMIQDINYYFRAFAVSNNTIYYGNVMQFSTQ